MDVEKVAAIQHEVWAHWMRHLYSKCEETDSGTLIIPAGLVTHWARQMDTPYAELSEREKQSDREIAERFSL